MLEYLVKNASQSGHLDYYQSLTDAFDKFVELKSFLRLSRIR
jgi:hypothetical protein